MDSRVLIIEDEAQIRRILKNAMTDEGCHVSEAATIKDGLKQAGATNPELILLDLGLPDGDGISFIKEVRAWSDVPILILSARIDEKDKIVGVSEEFLKDRIARFKKYRQTLIKRQDEYEEKLEICDADLKAKKESQNEKASAPAP